MRRTIIIALTVLALALILCAAGSQAVDRAVSGAETLRQSAERAAWLGDIDTAFAEARADGVGGAVGRGVVDHEHVARGSLPRDCFEAGEQHRLPVERYDDGDSFGHAHVLYQKPVQWCIR